MLNTPWDVVILDEMFATAQGAMALKIREKFDSKLATFATTGTRPEFPLILRNSYSRRIAVQISPVSSAYIVAFLGIQ